MTPRKSRRKEIAKENATEQIILSHLAAVVLLSEGVAAVRYVRISNGIISWYIA